MGFKCLWLGGVKVGGLEEGGYNTPHLPPLTSLMCFWLHPTSPTATTTTSEWNILHSPAPLHSFQGHVWYLADAGILLLVYFFFNSLLPFLKRKRKRTGLAGEEGWIVFLKHLPWSTCLPRGDVMWWVKDEGSFLKSPLCSVGNMLRTTFSTSEKNQICVILFTNHRSRF